jgi:hypothetical protein
VNPLERIRLSDAYLELIRQRWEGQPQPHPYPCTCADCVALYIADLDPDYYRADDDDEAGQ